MLFLYYKSLHIPKSWRFPLFFSWDFIALAFILRFMIHLWFNFCVQPEVKVEDHFIPYEYPAVSAPFVHWINLASLLKINWPHLPGSISGLYSVSLICVYILPISHHLDDYGLTILQPGGICPLTVFSFQIVLAILGPFHFHIKVRTSSLEGISKCGVSLHWPARKKLRLDPEMENLTQCGGWLVLGSDGEMASYELWSWSVCKWPIGDVLSLSHSLLRSVMCFVLGDECLSDMHVILLHC